MQDVTLARGVGWISIGLGLALIVAPKQTGYFFGVEHYPRLAQALGIRDLALAGGLLTQRDLASWMWLRFAGEIYDTLLVLLGAITNRLPRGRALAGAVGAGSFAAFDYVLARRLQDRQP